MPKLTPDQWTEHPGAPHPYTGQNGGPYAEIALGDVLGLSQFGVHLEWLPVGLSGAPL